MQDGSSQESEDHPDPSRLPSWLRRLKLARFRPQRTVLLNRRKTLLEDAITSPPQADSSPGEFQSPVGTVSFQRMRRKTEEPQAPPENVAGYRREEISDAPRSAQSTSSPSLAMSLSPASVVVTQVDYVGYLIPKLQEIVACPFYWGKIDRYEAERLLERASEGSFLLRDSAQDEFVFSVSFRRYNRSLHARIEESSHMFSFDCHDPGVHRANSITGLLEHYKDPLACMFFEPMLLHPLPRREAFSLQELARSVICDHCSYNAIGALPIPKPLQNYLREYNYKHKIRTRQIVTQEQWQQKEDGVLAEKDIRNILESNGEAGER